MSVSIREAGMQAISDLRQTSTAVLNGAFRYVSVVPLPTVPIQACSFAQTCGYG